MGDESLRDWDKPGVAERALEALRAFNDEMSRTPGSGVAVCHPKGKTSVYLSADGKYLVEHNPEPGGRRSTGYILARDRQVCEYRDADWRRTCGHRSGLDESPRHV